jgi:hypothetical protein
LNLLSLNWLQTEIRYIVAWGGSAKIIFCHHHWSFHLAYGV